MAEAMLKDNNIKAEHMEVEEESNDDFDPAEYLDARMEMDPQDDSIELDEKVESKPEWVVDSTVPQGYMRRIFDNNVTVSPLGMPAVLAPDGGQYRSRVAALRTLIRRKASEQEIEEMLGCLEFEGWESHPLLPTTRWRFRKNQRDFHKTRVELLSENMVIFKSNKDAMNYAKKNFSEAIYIQLESFIDLMSVEMRMQSYEWKNGDSVPNGWKMRISEGPKAQKLFFLSPDGKSFPTRTAAFQYMVKENYDEDQIDQMKLKMVEHERWQYSGKVPSGWLLKDNKATGSKYQVIFMSREGQLLESFLKAYEYVRNQEGYSSLDLDLLQELSEDRSNENRLNGYQWVESKSLPSSWKIRSHVGKVERDYILSPTGKQFPCRRLAYMSMFEDNYSQDDIEIMRQFLMQEGWSTHKQLPNQKWLFSTKDDGRFLSDCGKYFKSFKKASEFIKQNFTEVEVSKLESLFDMESVRRRTVRYTWSQDKTVPDGWLTRESKGKRGASLFLLSPDGEQFQCRRLALTSLIKNGADKDEIENMRAMIHHEGYERSPLLPENWFYRDVSDTVYHIFTDTGDLYDSFFSVKEFMSNNDFPGDQISNMDKFEKAKLKSRQINCSKWEKNPYLPSGFMSRPRGHDLAILSPEGEQFSNRRTALQFMIKSGGYQEEEIQIMRDYMIEENWEEHSDLPRGWLIRNIKGSSTGLLFTREGDVLETQISGRQYMESNGYTEFDLSKLNQAFEDVNKRIKLTEAANEYDNQATNKSFDLPGWSLKYKNSTLQSLTSPSGVECSSRMEALQLMNREGYPDKDIKYSLTNMKIEGWKFSKLLPSFWMYKLRKLRSEDVFSYDIQFLSPVGQLFGTISEISQKIRSDSQFKDFDINMMEKYFSNIQNKVMNSGECWESDDRLPDGFRVRVHRGKIEKTFYLARDGSQFPSLKLLLVHMLESHYDVDDVRKVKDLMCEEDGYEESDLLPSHWIMKYVRSKFKNDSGIQVTLISNTGEVFKSFVTAIEMMKTNFSFTEADINNLKLLMTEKSNQKRRSLDIWQEDETLPVGWRFRKAVGTRTDKTLFLSPEGEQFQSRVTVLLHLINNNYPEDVVKVVRDSLHAEGFEMSGFLPKNWLFRSRSKSGYLTAVDFLSSDGQWLKSFSTVYKTIKDNKKYSQKDIDNMKKFMDLKGATRRKSSDFENTDTKKETKISRENRTEIKKEIKIEIEKEPSPNLLEKKSTFKKDIEIKKELSHSLQKKKSNTPISKVLWSKDSSVPSSWRVSEGENCKFFRDSEGRIFKSRRLALAQMISNQVKATDVKKMREGLGTEGWNRSSLLPPDWWYKASKDEKQSIEVITEDGGLLSDLKTIKDFIKEMHSSYNRKFVLFWKTVQKN